MSRSKTPTVPTQSLLALLRKKKLPEAYKVARANPKLVDTEEDGETPFQWACRFGDKNTMMELLKLGANLKQLDEEGELPIELVADGTPYATAAQVADRTGMLAALLAAKSPLGDKVLAKACTLGAGKASQMVKLLVGVKAKGDFVEEDGSTILHLACEYDLPDALGYGLQLGVDVNATTSKNAFAGGSSALHVAVKRRRTAMVQQLVAAGARADLVNTRKETPLTLATRELRAILEGTQPAPKRPTPAAAPNKGVRDIVAQLWNAPHDEALLGVYADCLIEQGEASRGEYIRLALLEKPTPDQVKRKEKLLAKDRGRWLGDARKLVSEWTDSTSPPGFVASATTSVDKAIAHLDQLAGLGPLVTLRLTPIKTRLLTRKLAELPLGRKVYGLHFYNTVGTYTMNRDWLDDTSMGILGPALIGLRALVLAPAVQASCQEKKGFTTAAIDSLAPASPSLVSLTLDLTDSTEPAQELLDAITPAKFPVLETLTFVALDKKRHKRIRTAWAKSRTKLVFTAS